MYIYIYIYRLAGEVDGADAEQGLVRRVACAARDDARDAGDRLQEAHVYIYIYMYIHYIHYIYIYI